MERALKWLVIGLGRAGQARLRDMAAVEDHEVVAGLSARALGPAPAAGASHPCLADSSVDAVVIATANRDHGAWAEASLRAGKHTLVEFPLCATAAEAERLFALAEARGKVLHVELIGLLTGAFRDFETQLVPPLSSLRSTFSGGIERWLADELAAGHVGQLAVGRLHALWQLAGPLNLESASAVFEGDGYRIEARMRGQGDVEVVLIERRAPGLQRGSSLVATLPDGSRSERGPVRRGEALFAADLAACARRIRGGGSEGGYVANNDVIAVLALAEAISATCGP